MQDQYQPLIDEFNQSHPAITVQFVPINFNAADTTPAEGWQRMAGAADTTLLTGQANILLAGAYFQDLGPLMETEASFKPDDFWDGALAGCQNETGQSIGVPIEILPLGIVVDQEAFTAAGLALPQPGWTWTDFQATLQTLAEKVPGLQAPVFADELITPGQVSMGDYLLKPVIDEYLRTSGVNFDPQGVQEQVGRYQDFVARGLIEPVQTVEAGAAQRNAWAESYPDGQPPLWVGSVNSEPLNGKTNGVATLLPFPVSENGEIDHTTPLYASCGVVSSGSLHPREAFLPG